MNSKILRDMGHDPYKESPTSSPNGDIGNYKSPSKFENEWKDFYKNLKILLNLRKALMKKLQK